MIALADLGLYKHHTLIILIPIEYSMIIGTARSGWTIVYVEGLQNIISKKVVKRLHRTNKTV